jgi:hypothetical protein
LILGVDVANVSPPYTLHESAKIADFSRFDQEMDMIRHQNVGVNPGAAFTFCLSKAVYKEPVIIIGEKHRLAIVAALDNVMRICRNRNSRRP